MRSAAPPTAPSPPLRMTEEAHARLRAWLLLVCTIVLLIAAGFRHAGDFESFYIAGTQFLKRLNPYSPELYQTYRSFGMSSLPPAIVLTCLPCLLPLYAAVPAWDIFCLLLWAASLYLWAELLWDSPVDFPSFARLCAVGLIAPLCWAFTTHQVTVPVFFIATFACWATRRQVHVGWAGVAAGLMLMKPHLTLLLAAALFLKSNRKLLFITGMAAGLVLPYIPFMNMVRPVSDLRAWALTIKRQQTEVYYMDEQGLGSRLASFFPIVTHAEAKTSKGPGILIPKSRGRFLIRLKTAFWIAGACIWGLWWRKTRNISALTLASVPSATPSPACTRERATPSEGQRPATRLAGPPDVWRGAVGEGTGEIGDLAVYAVALAWGLLISPYSHFYDGVLLTPLILLTFSSAGRSRELTDLFPLFFGFNFTMVSLAVLARRYDFYLWPLMGWTSIAYCAFAASIYAWANRPIFPLLCKGSGIR